MNHGAGDVDLLFHSCGEFFTALVGIAVDSEDREHFVDTLFQRFSFQALEFAEETDHLAGSEPVVETGGAGEKTDGAPHFLRLGGDVETVHCRESGSGRERSREHPQGRGLARAVQAQKAEDLLGVAGEAHSTDRADTFASAMIWVDLHQVVDFDAGQYHREVLSRRRRRRS